MIVDTDVTFIGETIAMPLTFPPGQSTMTVESAVVRGTRNRHRLQTRAGQFLSIELRAAEHNAEFTVHDRHGALLAEVTGEAGWHAWSGALIEEGEVAMAKNYALVDAEVDAGFVLTCQAHPVSDKVTVRFDHR